MERDKGKRILDAAEELLLRVGYRKVAMSEVAGRAAVGKGTVYLYWPSKADLFGTVLVRESVRRLDEQITELLADPGECRLHRSYRSVFRQALRSPLLKALYTRDYDVLGEVLTTSEVGARFTAINVEVGAQYLALLHRHGLLADDPSTDPMLSYRLSAALGGAFLVENSPDNAAIDVDVKADAVATTLRRAFEPADEPAPEVLGAAAGEVVELFRKWRDDMAGSLPGGDL